MEVVVSGFVYSPAATYTGILVCVSDIPAVLYLPYLTSASQLLFLLIHLEGKEQGTGKNTAVAVGWKIVSRLLELSCQLSENQDNSQKGY